MTTVAGAAFARYAREASDYTTGAAQRATGVSEG